MTSFESLLIKGKFCVNVGVALNTKEKCCGFGIVVRDHVGSVSVLKSSLLPFSILVEAIAIK